MAARVIEKILFLKNPFDVLGVTPDDTMEKIEKAYKKLAIRVHPDKCALPEASDAFDKIKKALTQLQDPEVFDSFAKMIAAANKEIEATPALAGLSAEEKAVRRIDLVDQALHRFDKAMTVAEKNRLANEAFEKERKMKERLQAKRQREAEATWEETREERVGDWRSFVDKRKKKRKKEKSDKNEKKKEKKANKG